MPPTFPVVHTIISWNYTEILIGLGQGRLLIGQTENQVVPTGYQIAWGSTISMSPQTAKHLYEQLTEFLAKYEATYGKIPMDGSLKPIQKEGNVISINETPGPSQGTWLDQLMARGPKPAEPEPDPPAS